MYIYVHVHVLVPILGVQLYNGEHSLSLTSACLHYIERKLQSLLGNLLTLFVFTCLCLPVCVYLFVFTFV